MRFAWLALGLAALALGAGGDSGLAARGPGPESPIFDVDFTNPGLIPAHWTLTLNPDGSGHFRSEKGSPETRAKTAQEELNPPDVNRDVHVSAEFAQHVFEVARRHRFFNEECESHMKVAFQGWKKLSYTGPAGQGSCTFNYAKDKEISALGDSLVAVAETILEGARLEALLQYDRLGLDKEMEYLVAASGDGRIQQICTIRGILERLAQDDTVLDRVRRRAKALLTQAGT